jgi:GNAT superfamily N-acetyltransferase
MSSIVLKEFCPARHGVAAQQLWQACLATSYPMTARTLRMIGWDRPNYQPGDGVVALAGETVVGLGLLEIARPATADLTGSISVLLVHPSHQRQGLGTRLLAALEARLLTQGCTAARPGCGLTRFWAGVPTDLPAAHAFFSSRGYPLKGQVWDLVVDLAPDQYDGPAWRAQLAAAGLTLESSTLATIGDFLSFECREFPGWVGSSLRLAGAGEVAGLLQLRHQGELVGTIQAFQPASRFRPQNLAWDGVFGAALGGYGAVGIAKACRGRNWGKLMCGGAGAWLQEQGASHAMIDWTGLVDFYAKVGAKPWRAAWQGHKALAPLT